MLTWHSSLPGSPSPSFTVFGNVPSLLMGLLHSSKVNFSGQSLLIDDIQVNLVLTTAQKDFLSVHFANNALEYL